MATLEDVVVDCAHPASLARFWAAALDEYEVPPYTDRLHVDLSVLDVEAEVDRLVRLGAGVGADHGHLVSMLDREGNEFCLLRPG